MEEKVEESLVSEQADYANFFEDSIFNPVPFKRTEIKVAVVGSALMTRAGVVLFNEMSRVYKGFSSTIYYDGDKVLTPELVSKYLQTLIFHRICASTNVKVEGQYNINRKAIQVPAFMYPILKALGPAIDTSNGIRYVPTVTNSSGILKRDEMETISSVIYSLRQYNFSSEAGLPVGNGSLDLMAMAITGQEITTIDFKDNAKLSSDTKISLKTEYSNECISKTINDDAMVFSPKRCHPVNGFFTAFLGLVNELSMDDSLKIVYGHVSDYVGSIPRILQPRQ